MTLHRDMSSRANVIVKLSVIIGEKGNSGLSTLLSVSVNFAIDFSSMLDMAAPF
jgi:hypothetical protein